MTDRASVCPGNPEEKYLDMIKAKKGVLKSPNGEKIAEIDEAFQVALNGKRYLQTIFATNCSLLIHGTKCQKHARIIDHILGQCTVGGQKERMMFPSFVIIVTSEAEKVGKPSSMCLCR